MIETGVVVVIARPVDVETSAGRAEARLRAEEAADASGGLLSAAEPRIIGEGRINDVDLASNGLIGLRFEMHRELIPAAPAA